MEKEPSPSKQPLRFPGNLIPNSVPTLRSSSKRNIIISSLLSRTTSPGLYFCEMRTQQSFKIRIKTYSDKTIDNLQVLLHLLHSIYQNLKPPIPSTFVSFKLSKTQSTNTTVPLRVVFFFFFGLITEAPLLVHKIQHKRKKIISPHSQLNISQVYIHIFSLLQAAVSLWHGQP